MGAFYERSGDARADLRPGAAGPAALGPAGLFRPAGDGASSTPGRRLPQTVARRAPAGGHAGGISGGAERSRQNDPLTEAAAGSPQGDAGRFAARSRPTAALHGGGGSPASQPIQLAAILRGRA